MKEWIPILLLAAGLGCVPPNHTLYDWGGYDANLHALMKDPTALEAYGLCLKHQIEGCKDDTRVPPGIYAEYGYVLYATGHRPESLEFFRREKARWPESARIMDRMIANCAQPQPPAAGAPTKDM